MIDDEQLREWLEARTPGIDGKALPYSVGPRIPEFGNGDLLAVVTPVGGPGETMEGINTVVGFQVRWVGRIHQYSALKTAVWAAHRALIFADVPNQLWGTWVTWVRTAGGDPVPDNPDGLDKDRAQFVCTYLTEIAL